MLSSNSGFQRLSQAALSRSRFLRLAAGALLPFVGWRQSAAAAPNAAPHSRDGQTRSGTARFHSGERDRDVSENVHARYLSPRTIGHKMRKIAAYRSPPEPARVLA